MIVGEEIKDQLERKIDEMNEIMSQYLMSKKKVGLFDYADDYSEDKEEFKTKED